MTGVQTCALPIWRIYRYNILGSQGISSSSVFFTGRCSIKQHTDTNHTLYLYTLELQTPWRNIPRCRWWGCNSGNHPFISAGISNIFFCFSCKQMYHLSNDHTPSWIANYIFFPFFPFISNAKKDGWMAGHVLLLLHGQGEAILPLDKIETRSFSTPRDGEAGSPRHL